jgi:hypothetical protein
MKRLFFWVILSSLVLGGCSLSPKKSAIEINSYPTAKVYLDEKEVGTTPYKNRSLRPGEVDVKLVTDGNSWSKKIKLQNNVNTVIDWEFGPTQDESGGYVLYLEKTGDKKSAGLMVMSEPSGATISIDNEIKGFSPIKINDIGEGDKHLTINFPGRKNTDVFVKAVNEYRLILDLILAKESVEITNQNEYDKENSDLLDSEIKVKIKETETGWLRVRESSSSAAKEIAKVEPGKTYSLLEETDDWFKISLEEGQEGWISSKYADKE